MSYLAHASIHHAAPPARRLTRTIRTNSMPIGQVSRYAVDHQIDSFFGNNSNPNSNYNIKRTFGRQRRPRESKVRQRFNIKNIENVVW